MITCPKCSATLPDWAKSCQFCHADVTKIARPVVVDKKKNYYEPAKWVWVFYYIIAVYNLLSGSFDIASSARLIWR